MEHMLILNVDDHEPGRYARTRLLQQAGYSVLEAGTGGDAIMLVKEKMPALVMLDVNLPDIDGLEVCRHIKRHPGFATIPVLQISASAVSNSDRVSGLESGADAYLIEPVDSEVLLATVRALLRMRQAEEELHLANAALQAANSALEKVNAELRLSNDDLQRFSYLASHDLQEPLRTIRSFAALLGRRYQGQLDAAADEYLGHIDSAAIRMSRLIDDLLSYAQITQEKEHLHRAVNTEVALDLACEDLAQSLRESSADIVHGPLPTVLGDEGQLIQLFQNLIGNAVKYRSPETHPVIRVNAERHAGDKWLFSITDNGVGIEIEYQDVIFSAFKRLHGREVPGTGLGLATCRRIVERHGGRIWAESEGAGKGSSLRFTLPDYNAAGNPVSYQTHSA